jgi:microcystin-dependent protein
MSCSNCYNGCSEIVSDKCVKYTGIDIPVLGITTGDSLAYVEQQIIDFLTSTLDGSGIVPKIDSAIICQIVKDKLPNCGDINIVDFIKALIQIVCELKVSITTNTDDIQDIQDFIDDLEGSYTLNCLNDTSVLTCPINVTSTSGTHDIVQAIINKLCCLITYAEATYVKLADIDAIIQNYIGGTSAATKFYTRMVPYVVVPFYPTSGILSKFNSGVGQDEWEKIYFCNGDNGTPDMRGRIPVGVTTGMFGSTAMDSFVTPGGLNPNYQINSKFGRNDITLLEAQMPRHDHTATGTSTATVSPNPHKHSVSLLPGGGIGNPGSAPLTQRLINPTATNVDTTDVSLSVSVTTNVTVGLKGNNEAHANNQPGLGLYYIMYIP